MERIPALITTTERLQMATKIYSVLGKAKVNTNENIN